MTRDVSLYLEVLPLFTDLWSGHFLTCERKSLLGEVYQRALQQHLSFVHA